MLPGAQRRIEEMLPEAATVLDVGGWAKPLARADWVVDLMPYETRGMYGEHDRTRERFTAETWLSFDICAREPWPFADDQFDFAVCSHTLEDVRDPVWVCSELSRVARAGYVEVPSRLEEQSWNAWGGEWVGWSHHHWLTDVEDGRLTLVFKPHLIHANPEYYFPDGVTSVLTDAERVISLFWEGEVESRERIFFDEDEFDRYLAAPVRAHRAELLRRVPRASMRQRAARALARLRSARTS
jgi:Methyltransferase domain